jgi:UDP-N-acetylmuramate--alanine ligase
MLAFILSRMGMSPSYVVGGDFDVPGSGGHAGKGGIFVAEVDESDRSHIGVTMSVAVIMNIDHDHPEVYAGQTDLVDAYEACIRHGMREGGTLVLNADSAGCRELAARLAADSGGPQVVTFGTTSSAHWRLTHVSTSDGRSEAVLRAPGGREFDLALRIPGVHQLLNAAAAIATVDVMGQDCEPALEQLSFFDGMRRRMTPAGEQAGVRIFDSYAHHPEEVSADLSAARSVVGADGRVLVVFQPSGHARLDAFGAEFGKALAGCDQVVLTDWTRGLPETALERLAGLIDSAGGVARHVRADRAQAVVCAAREARPGDVVVLMGSGDIAEFGPALLAALDSVQPAAA